MGVVALALVGWSGLTAEAIRTTPKQPETADIESGEVQGWQELSPEELAGIGFFRKENCVSCHGSGSKTGPDLTKMSAIHKNAAWMIAHFKRPQQMMPGTSMPSVQLTDSQLNGLAAFLLKLNSKNSKELESAPQFAVEGAMVYQQQRCGMCHQVNGVGMKAGPPLNKLASRRSREWVEDHFRDPQKMSPGTVMPPYKFNSRDMDRITSYLLALP